MLDLGDTRRRKVPQGLGDRSQGNDGGFSENSDLDVDLPGPQVLVQNGGLTNATCSMGIIKRTCTEKKYPLPFWSLRDELPKD